MPPGAESRTTGDVSSSKCQKCVTLTLLFYFTYPFVLLSQPTQTLDHLNDNVLQGRDITEMQGFICHKSDHWFALREIGGRFWNLNSTLERPEAVSHFALATEMQQTKKLGYTIFAIPSGLPPVGQKHGVAGAGWHRMSDLLQGKSTDKDPWDELKGSGMRLDNKAAPVQIEGLTEEEQIAMAVHHSLQSSSPPNALQNVAKEYPIPDEPAKGEKGSCRIQLRMPDGSRVIRLFRRIDPVGCIFALVASHCAGKPFALKAGYPPQDLSEKMSQSIDEASLAGESIQVRYI